MSLTNIYESLLMTKPTDSIRKSKSVSGHYLWFLGGIFWALLALSLATGNFHNFNSKIMRNFNIIFTMGSMLLISLFAFLPAIKEMSDVKREGFLLWSYLAGESFRGFLAKKTFSLIQKPLLFLLPSAFISFITCIIRPYSGPMILSFLRIYLMLSLTTLFSLALGILASRIFRSQMGKIGWPYLFTILQLTGVFILASLTRPFPFLQKTLTPALWVNPLAWMAELCQFDLIRWDLIYQYSSLGGYRFSYPPLGFSSLFLLVLILFSFLAICLTSNRR